MCEEAGKGKQRTAEWDRSHSHQLPPQGLGPEIDWTRSGNAVKVWKKLASLNGKKKGLLGFNSRVAMVGGRSSNVGLMFS